MTRCSSTIHLANPDRRNRAVLRHSRHLYHLRLSRLDILPAHSGIPWLAVRRRSRPGRPQQAVGAIWRARRVVTLGDPLQLEPVVPLSIAAQQALRRTFSVDDDRWLPGRTSVQRLADQRTAYGTFLPGAESPVRVGAPLRVHRRCDKPMFDVSNAIAYDGLMVYGKPQLPDLRVPPSKWIDVPSGDSISHWMPAEGTMLNQVVGWLTATSTSWVVLCPTGSARLDPPHRVSDDQPDGSLVRS